MRKSFAIGSMGCLLVGSSFLAGRAMGEVILPVDPSFDSPPVSASDSGGFGVRVDFDSHWVVGGTQGLVGRFLNQADDTPFPGAKHVDEDGTSAVPSREQIVGYMAAGTLDSGQGPIPATTAVEISQTLTNLYTLGQSYSMTTGLAKSSLQPASAAAVIDLALFYTDTGNVRHLIPGATIRATGAELFNNKTVDYSTPAFTVGAGDAFLNRPIGVLITTAANDPNTIGGEFDFDNVSVTAVPEPATISLAAGAFGLAMLRRRRA